MTVKLLLVEDHAMNRDMLTRRLKKIGYQVITACDGEEAIGVAVRDQPELILMDMSLPVLDGWEATRRIKMHSETKHIPIIALTAFVHEFDRARALEAGCDEYETKPVDMTILIDKIERLTGASTAAN